MDDVANAENNVGQKRLQKLRRQVSRFAPFVSGVVSVLAGLVLYNTFFPGTPPPTQRDVNAAIATRLAETTPRPAFSVGVYQAIQPSLVLIQTKRPSDDPEKEAANGLGSGVVVNDRGDILTSLHVVEFADEITVTFADGTTTTAEVTTSQPENDIAVLHPSETPPMLVPATIGSPQSLRIGDEAYAVGNPLGLYGSMSSGVISGLDRSFQPEGDRPEMTGLIQIDAAVNPGNSGGPLLNRYGQVVGIVTGLVNPSGQDAFSGIGFAVPINVAGGAAGLPPF